MRKAVALLIIVLLALPTLFAAIWAVGLTRAALSPELLADLPHRIITQLPELTDELVTAAEDGRAQIDADSRMWLRAIARSPVKLEEAMRKSGLASWAEGELADSLTRLGQVLRGKAHPGEAELDLRPLKTALSSEVWATFTEGVVAGLPPCDDQGLARWQGRVAGRGSDLPPCRPSEGVAVGAWKEVALRAVRDMPDRVDYFSGDHALPSGVNFAKVVVALSAVVFLLPLLFLLMGAGIAGGGWGKFLHWFGLSSVAGGVLAWGSVEIGRRAMLLGATEGWHRGGDSLFPAVHWFLFQPGSGILATVGQLFFDPVAMVAQTVCVIGLILFALGYFVKPKTAASPREAPAA